jgi:hypothetical protein
MDSAVVGPAGSAIVPLGRVARSNGRTPGSPPGGAGLDVTRSMRELRLGRVRDARPNCRGERQLFDRARKLKDSVDGVSPGDDRQLPTVVFGAGVRGEERMQAGGVDELERPQVDHDPSEAGFDQVVELALELPDCCDVELAGGNELDRVALRLDIDPEVDPRIAKRRFPTLVHRPSPAERGGAVLDRVSGVPL